MNRKGYMLVEIVLASVIAFGVAFFIINLTIKLKNKNDDVLVLTQVSTDQAIITNRLMAYAIQEKEEFNCNEIRISNNKITYKNNLIDIVNDYAGIETYTCTNANGAINITIPVEILQLDNKDYDVNINYKYIIGDLSNPQLYVTVTNGTAYAKSRSATIKLTDNEALANGTYKLKYGWGNSNLTCDKMTKELTFTIDNNQTVVTQNVTIAGENGAGRIYVCTDNPIYDIYNNELPKNVIVNASMYLDNTGPIIALGTYIPGYARHSVTIPLKVTDNLSGASYNSFTPDDVEVYVGTNRVTNVSLSHTGTGNYSLVVTNDNYNDKISIKIPAGKVVDNASNSNTATELKPNITFNNEYTITYDANGGSVSPSSKKVMYGSKYGDLPSPSRTGYIFNGWYTVASGGDKVTKDTTFNSTADKTIYAQWSVISYTIRYNANGGSGTMSTTSCNYDADCNLRSNAFTRTNYKFNGWATSSGGGVSYNNSQSVKNLTATNGATVDLYAVWELNAINCNGGTYLPANWTSCNTCPANYQCPGGTFTIANVDQGISACPAEYESAAGSISCTVKSCVVYCKRNWTDCNRTQSKGLFASFNCVGGKIQGEMLGCYVNRPNVMFEGCKGIMKCNGGVAECEAPDVGGIRICVGKANHAYGLRNCCHGCFAGWAENGGGMKKNGTGHDCTCS